MLSFGQKLIHLIDIIMEKKYLNKTMVEFVKDKPTPSAVNRYGIVDFYKDVIKYANALSQTPRLGHFIPCDENDVPLQEPKDFKFFMQGIGGHIDVTYEEYKKYQQACDRVLFEGFKLVGERCIELENCDLCIDFSGKNIIVTDVLCVETTVYTMEHLIEHEPPLTDNGAKVFGL